MGQFNDGEAFHPHDGAMQSFAPADFHEQHDLHQHYPTWSSIGMGTTHPSSLDICPETLDPALYPGELFQQTTTPLDQHMPFPHHGPGAMPFGQSYDDTWSHMSHPGVMPWQDTNTGSTGPDGAHTHLSDVSANRPHTTIGTMHPQPTLRQTDNGSLLKEERLFGKIGNEQAADNIADKTKVKSVLGNMQRMDSLYRNYAREHLLDMDPGTEHGAGRPGRSHHMIKKKHRVRGSFKKRKRGDLPRD